MKFPALMERWGLFAALVFLLLGVTLAYLEAGPVAGHGIVARYAFWMATAAATFLAWWLSQWCIVSGRERLTRGLLLASCLLATLLFVPASLLIDALFGISDAEGAWWSSLIEEWWVSAPPVFASLMLAYLGTGFADWEIARAASLQRYSMHFGFAACATSLPVAAAWALETAQSAFARPASARPIVLGFVGVGLA